MASRKSEQTARIFDGVAEHYHRYRLRTPPVVTRIVGSLIDRNPDVVVDLGCGTGLSTLVWMDVAAYVVGIEPNREMRDLAEDLARDAGNVEIRDGDSSRTGLNSDFADVVTCVESLHWMEPEPTLVEVGRILREGGIFVGIARLGCPIIHPRVEAAYAETVAAARRVAEQKRLWAEPRMYDLNAHLNAWRGSPVFSSTRSIHFHDEIEGTAEDFQGWVRATGAVRGVLAKGVSEQEIGFPRLSEMAAATLGDHPKPWFVECRMIIAARAAAVNG
jgi:SAM-dependent methyltransferase